MHELLWRHVQKNRAVAAGSYKPKTYVLEPNGSKTLVTGQADSVCVETATTSEQERRNSTFAAVGFMSRRRALSLQLLLLERTECASNVFSTSVSGNDSRAIISRSKGRA